MPWHPKMTRPQDKAIVRECVEERWGRDDEQDDYPSHNTNEALVKRSNTPIARATVR
jgi:hypothetical protein